MVHVLKHLFPQNLESRITIFRATSTTPAFKILEIVDLEVEAGAHLLT